jgi:small subunit ribosomal protein S2e
MADSGRGGFGSRGGERGGDRGGDRGRGRGGRGGRGRRGGKSEVRTFYCHDYEAEC